MRTFRGITFLALALCACLGSGCASGMHAPSSDWWSFNKKKKKEQSDDGIVTPYSKMKQLRELSKQSADMTPELQERVTNELAHGIVHEQDPVLRAQILRTLGHFPNEKSAAILAAGLRHDGNRDVRIAACDGLGRQKGDKAAEELSHALAEDADVDVRLAAARALGNTGDPKAVAALGTALDDQDPAMRHRALSSLKQVSGKDYGDDLEAWRQYAKTGTPPEEPSLAQRLRKLF